MRVIILCQEASFGVCHFAEVIFDKLCKLPRWKYIVVRSRRTHPGSSPDGLLLHLREPLLGCR